MSATNLVQVVQENTLVVVGGAQSVYSSTQFRPSAGPIGGSKVLRHALDGTVDLASADNLAHSGVLAGVSVNAVSGAGQEVEIRRLGEFYDSGWSWIPGLPVYVGLAGVLTQTYSPSWAFVCIVGAAITPTRVDLTFEPAITQS